MFPEKTGRGLACWVPHSVLPVASFYHISSLPHPPFPPRPFHVSKAFETLALAAAKV